MHSGPFGCLTILGAKRAELVQKFVHEVASKLDPKLTFWCVSYHLGAFGTVWLPYETQWKTGRTVRNFVPRNCVGIFRNKSTRSTGLYPKLTFWCVLHYLGAFGTVCLPYETRCKTGQTSSKVCATKSRPNFSQQTHPIHPIGQHTDVLVCSYYLGAFGTI